MISAGGPPPSASASLEWRRNWPLVLSASLSAGVINTHFYAFGVFMKPLAEATGWSRGEIGVALLIYSVMNVLLGPFVGLFADKVGPRRLALFGMMGYCATFGAFSLIKGNLIVLYLIATANAFCALFSNATILTMAITRHFKSGLGLALASTHAGSGLYASTFVPLMATYVIAVHGFRSAYLVIGIVGMIVAVPALLLFFDRGRRSDSPMMQERLPADATKEQRRASLTNRYFWRIALACFLVALGSTGLVSHFIPMLTDGGLTPSAAAGFAAIVGTTSLICRITTGALLDRFSASLIGAICFLAPAAACILLATSHGSAQVAFAVALLLGVAVGAEVDIISYTVVRYIGSANYGLVFGIIYGVMSLGTGVGAALTGTLFDLYGNYRIALFLYVGTCASASLLFLLLEPWGRRRAAGD